MARQALVLVGMLVAMCMLVAASAAGMQLCSYWLRLKTSL